MLSRSSAIERDLWKRVVVLSETDSTQDEARRIDARVGDVIVAGRQRRGRGRLGRAWLDTGDEGVAVTFVVDAAQSERLSIACAIDVAHAVIASMKVTNGWQTRKVKVGIKWPNDIIANGRKIAGVLIAQSDSRAFIGIGINVRQTLWPAELRSRAISLVELGFNVDRVVVIDVLMQSLGWAWRDDDERLVAQFCELDLLTGATGRFRVGDREVRGKVLRVDPMKGLAVLTDTEGEVWLPAATTMVIRD